MTAKITAMKICSTFPCFSHSIGLFPVNFWNFFRAAFLQNSCGLFLLLSRVFLWCAEMFYENLEDRRAKRDRDRERKKLEITIIWCLS